MATKKIKTKYTQQQIADKLGISQGTVHNWLYLKTQPVNLAREKLKEHYPAILERIDAAWTS